MVKTRRVPGEDGVWVLICGDMFAFSAFFLVFNYYRAQAPAVFAAGRDSLNGAIGLTNTVLLLTSSLMVAIGVHRAREGRQSAGRFFAAALAMGLGFVLLKALEYGEKITAGITPLTNDFYMYYYVLTGVHLMHVLIGSAGLLAMAMKVRARAPSPERTMFLECGASFWHLVDLLWIVLFALFYIAGR